MSEQELLAKARMSLDRLQMQDIYNLMQTEGAVIGVANLYQKVVVTFENKKQKIFSKNF